MIALNWIPVSVPDNCKLQANPFFVKNGSLKNASVYRIVFFASHHFVAINFKIVELITSVVFCI